MFAGVIYYLLCVLATKFSSLWSPVSSSLLEKLSEGDVRSCDAEIQILQHLIPHVKSKHGEHVAMCSFIKSLLEFPPK